MDKKSLEVPHLFALEKSNKFHVSLRLQYYLELKENNAIESYVSEQLRLIMFNDIEKTLDESEIILYPRISKLMTDMPRQGYKVKDIYREDLRVTLYYKVEYFACLIRIDPSVYETVQPVSSFSIRGSVGNYDGNVEKKICGVYDGSPKEKPYIFGGEQS